MTSRSDCEPLPKPTLSPFALARPGTFLRVGFFTAAVWCVPALRVPLVHSLINHFRQNRSLENARTNPPRVVFVLGLVSLINSLTSGKISLLAKKM